MTEATQWGSPDDDFEEEDVGHEVCSNNGSNNGSDDDGSDSGSGSNSGNENQQGNPDQSFADPVIVNRGPPIANAANQMYPIRCPDMFSSNLPIHPSSFFIPRARCTQTGLAEVRGSLSYQQEQFQNATDDLTVFTHYHRLQISGRTRALTNVAAAQRVHPHNSILSQENVNRARIMCENDEAQTVGFIRHLEQIANDLRRQILHLTREELAIRFGNNYMRQHPDHDFVIFILAEGNVLQRVNSLTEPLHTGVRSEYYTTTTTTTTTERPEEPIQRKKQSAKRPRSTRHNIHTNLIHHETEEENELNEHFDIINIDHVFEMTEILARPEQKNTLFIIPNKDKIYMALTKKIDEFLIIIHDSVQYYYTSGKFNAQLEDMKTNYFKFTFRLRQSSVAFSVKKQLINRLEKVMYDQLALNMHWFYSTEYAIDKVIYEIWACDLTLSKTKI